MGMDAVAHTRPAMPPPLVCDELLGPFRRKRSAFGAPVAGSLLYGHSLFLGFCPNSLSSGAKLGFKEGRMSSCREEKFSWVGKSGRL